MSTELLIEANVSKKILFECLDLAKKFEEKYSAYKSGSLLSRINAASGKKAIRCEEDEIEIFKIALEIAKTSNGLFDPSIGSLTQGLYGFGTMRENIPKQEELNAVKALVNFKLIQISDNEIFLTKKGMRLDLGGIGKGYVADKIMELLQTRGASKAIVSVGGEVCSFGKEYNIAIKSPFSDSNMAVIKSSKEMISISTSGDYARYIGSKEHHHILDSVSAKPNHHHSSITVIKNGLNTTTLDAVATIIFNSKPDKLKSIADSFGVAIISISPENGVLFENFSNLGINALTMYP